MEAIPPAIALTQRRAWREKPRDLWRIAWTVKNRGGQLLELSSVRLPHGQFKADEQKFAPPLTLEGRAAANFETLVRCDEPSGLVTENAFVIFEARWLGAPWRIFVRVRVEMSDGEIPNATVQLITTQEVGFSRRIEAN